MSGASERQIEHAEAMVALETDVSIRAVRDALSGAGRTDCADCGDDIDVARRSALPSATRCAECAARRERKRRRGW
ncbi:TraR/DksA C4-type zinc finger protein [Sphingomonas silueang]|uniref:TraR/DksA C4-type zinc finger protein n=1 Tax=Sphingomonas silueang TaxID=3156617 RepID=UPI0032B571FC